MHNGHSSPYSQKPNGHENLKLVGMPSARYSCSAALLRRRRVERHGAKFKVSTGEVPSAPAPEGVGFYKVRANGPEIELEL
jgi:hypothetical protein